MYILTNDQKVFLCEVFGYKEEDLVKINDLGDDFDHDFFLDILINTELYGANEKDEIEQGKRSELSKKAIIAFQISNMLQTEPK